jgi:hypothetical protein
MKIVFAILFASMLCGCNKPDAPASVALATPARWDYYLVKVEDRTSIFRTAIIIYPDKTAWPVADCADVLNLVNQHSWTEVWISGDGKQILVKRPYSGSGNGSIIATTVQKENGQ